MITLASRLTLDSRIRFRRFDQEGIVINQRTAEALVISEVATRLLELADGSRTMADAAMLLAAEFDADAEVIGSDLLVFAEELMTMGIASVVEGTP